MDSGAGVWRAGVATPLQGSVCYSWVSMYVSHRNQYFNIL
jgi:hypothetical protein